MSEDRSKPRRGGIPRGLARTGPALFSYGFRPFFLGAAIAAVVDVALWVGALTLGWPVGGGYGFVAWHAHEMLFGFSSAVVAGFLSTAVPNWTGRLPVSGRPLMALSGLWAAGRLVMLAPDVLGLVPSLVIDGLFLPVLALVCGREIVAGRKWNNLPIVGLLILLALANLCFHLSATTGRFGSAPSRLAVAALVVMITIIGGRIVPSFTRNWLNQHGAERMPVPFGRFDGVAVVVAALALLAWSVAPGRPIATGFAAIAAIVHTVRLARWRGLATVPERLLFILHVAYAFVPLGFAWIAAAGLGLVGDVAALHVMTVGAVSTMMLAVMTRATRGHTGRRLTASPLTQISYAAVLVAAVVRPAVDFAPEAATLLYAIAGLAHVAAFALFLVEYAPMLATARRG
jgi:uncharacterized protein involved in response to NO